MALHRPKGRKFVLHIKARNVNAFAVPDVDYQRFRQKFHLQLATSQRYGHVVPHS